ncbi:olfactory receptor 14C36-like [Chlamydotis macqueenii]
MSNSSSITEFLLLAFADTREVQLLRFWLFLGICLVSLLGNSLIITAIACDHHLHTPMYFFLLNLSVLHLGCISTTVPKAMANSLWDTRAISYSGCAAQVFFLFFLMSAEYCLLTVMAYDCYVGICKPLHYGTLLGSRACVHMAAAAWGSKFLTAVLHTANTFSLPLCKGNAVDQFFCEIPQILKLSCSDAYLRGAGLLVLSACFGCGCFVFIVLSYVQIFRAVLRIPSEQGRHKAFSTCLPHLAVVSLFLSTTMFAYLKPPSISSPILDLVVSFLYSVVPPAVNPFIYSMRNQELKDFIRKVISLVFLNRPSERGTSLAHPEPSSEELPPLPDHCRSRQGPSSVDQGPKDTPSEFLDKLRDTMRQHAPLDPGSEIGVQQLVSLFIGQSASDIRRKLQKLRPTESRNLETLLDEAWRVFSNREEEDWRKDKRMLASEGNSYPDRKSSERFAKETVLLKKMLLPTVNPASFLSGTTGEPVSHDCLETIEAVYSSRPDLKEEPLEDAEDSWYTDGISFVRQGIHKAGLTFGTKVGRLIPGAADIPYSDQD